MAKFLKVQKKSWLILVISAEMGRVYLCSRALFELILGKPLTFTHYLSFKSAFSFNLPYELLVHIFFSAF